MSARRRRRPGRRRKNRYRGPKYRPFSALILVGVLVGCCCLVTFLAVQDMEEIADHDVVVTAVATELGQRDSCTLEWPYEGETFSRRFTPPLITSIKSSVLHHWNAPAAVGDQLRVYIDPSQPEDYVLETGYSDARQVMYLTGAIAAFFMLLELVRIAVRWKSSRAAWREDQNSPEGKLPYKRTPGRPSS